MGDKISYFAKYLFYSIINILSIKNALHIVLPFVIPPGPPVINAAVD